jgi:hypothetical protein
VHHHIHHPQLFGESFLDQPAPVSSPEVPDEALAGDADLEGLLRADKGIGELAGEAVCDDFGSGHVEQRDAGLRFGFGEDVNVAGFELLGEQEDALDQIERNVVIEIRDAICSTLVLLIVGTDVDSVSH